MCEDIKDFSYKITSRGLSRLLLLQEDSPVISRRPSVIQDTYTAFGSVLHWFDLIWPSINPSTALSFLSETYIGFSWRHLPFLFRLKLHKCHTVPSVKISGQSVSKDRLWTNQLFTRLWQTIDYGVSWFSSYTAIDVLVVLFLGFPSPLSWSLYFCS